MNPALIDSIQERQYAAYMALVRILIDGFSLLHNWPELAPGQPRYSERARDELIRILTQYHDATGEPITIFFDGAGAPASWPKLFMDRQCTAEYIGLGN